MRVGGGELGNWRKGLAHVFIGVGYSEVAFWRPEIVSCEAGLVFDRGVESRFWVGGQS